MRAFLWVLLASMLQAICCAGAMFVPVSLADSVPLHDVSDSIPGHFPFLVYTDGGEVGTASVQIVRQQELAEFLVAHPEATLEIPRDHIELAQQQLSQASGDASAPTPGLSRARLAVTGSSSSRQSIWLELRADDEHLEITTYECQGRQSYQHRLGLAFGPALALGQLPWLIAAAVIANVSLLLAIIWFRRMRRSRISRLMSNPQSGSA